MSESGTEVKSTPGPWQAGQPFAAKIQNRGQCELIGIGNGSVHVGYVSITGLVGTVEAKSNAQLIAAAPELLEAVKETLLWLGNLQVLGANLSLGEEGDEMPNLERLADALAKAEGRDA